MESLSPDGRDRPDLSLTEAHQRAQGLLARADAGWEIGYPELADELFALVFAAVSPVIAAARGASIDWNLPIWDRISVKSSNLKP